MLQKETVWMHAMKWTGHTLSAGCPTVRSSSCVRPYFPSCPQQPALSSHQCQWLMSVKASHVIKDTSFLQNCIPPFNSFCWDFFRLRFFPSEGLSDGQLSGKCWKMKVAGFSPPPLQTYPPGERNKGFPYFQPFPEGREPAVLLSRSLRWWISKVS